MPQRSIWNGTHQESTELSAAINRNCSCQYDFDEARTVMCSPHRMLTDDQRALDGLVFMRQIADRLKIEEFAAPIC